MATWIFGYGSLIWKPDLPYVEERWGWVNGWERRFWQASPDHRGSPEQPGRVLTLTPVNGARCAGKAFRIDPLQESDVLAQLNLREQAGYTLLPIEFHSERGESVQARCYIGLKGNPWFLGAAPFEDVVKQVRSAHGPSGSNKEYILRLADALHGRMRKESDLELFRLADALRTQPKQP